MVLLLANFFDYYGVSLVLPNLIFRWKELGISPEGLGFVSSIYSISQLVGGLVLARLGDRRLGLKRTLLLSFAGAGLSYGLVGLATSLQTLVISRVLVGLVKQTSTCSTALITKLSTDSGRAQALGRLNSAMIVAMMAGQATGGALSERYGRRAPCFAAAALFVLAFSLVSLALPADLPSAPAPAVHDAGTATPAQGRQARTRSPSRQQRRETASASAAVESSSAVAGVDVARGWWGRLVCRGKALTSTFTSAFRSDTARRVLLFRLCYGFLMRSAYTLHALYEKERWELTPATAGYLSSYKQALGLGVNTLLLGFLSRHVADDRLVCTVLAVSAANAALESSHSVFYAYAAFNLPVSACAGTLMRTTLSSVFSKAIPATEAASALSVLDVLNSALGVVAPIYGGLLFGRLGVGMQPAVSVANYLILIALARATLGSVGVGAPMPQATERVTRGTPDAARKRKGD